MWRRDLLTHPRTGAQRDLDRRQAARWLLLLFVLTFLARWALVRCIMAPTILSDEWIYTEIARSLAAGHKPMWGLVELPLPNWIYPLLIAPAMAWPMLKAYAVMRLIGCLLVATAVWPAYRLAREVGSRRRALLAATLAALLPIGCYSATIMAENAFWPAVTLALWLIFRAIDRPAWHRGLLAGMACGLAFHVKPQGILLPAVAAGTILLFEAGWLWSRPAEGGSGARRWQAYALAFLHQWPMALGWALVMGVRYLEVILIEKPAAFSPMMLFGGYSAAVSSTPQSWPVVLTAFLGYLLIWIPAMGLLPALALAGALPGALWGRPNRRLALMVVLATLANGIILFICARHTMANDGVWTDHERYFGVFAAPVIAFFCVRPLWGGPWRDRDMLGIKLGMVAVAAALAMTVYAASTNRWLIASDAPTLGGPALFVHQAPAATVWPVVYAVLAGAGLLFALFRGRRAWREWVAVGCLLLAANLGWYGLHQAVLRRIGPEGKKIALDICRRMKKDDRLMILNDYIPAYILNPVGVRNVSQVVYRNPALKPPWYAVPLSLRQPDRAVRTAFPGHRTYLLVERSTKFNQRPVKKFGIYRLYLLRDDQPLCLLPPPSGTK